MRPLAEIRTTGVGWATEEEFERVFSLLEGALSALRLAETALAIQGSYRGGEQRKILRAQEVCREALNRPGALEPIAELSTDGKVAHG